jgi:hypothetical protein
LCYEYASYIWALEAVDIPTTSTEAAKVDTKLINGVLWTRVLEYRLARHNLLFSLVVCFKIMVWMAIDNVQYSMV